MNSENSINQKRNYDQFNNGHRGGNRGGRGRGGGGFNRGRGGRGGGRGGSRGGGSSKHQNKSQYKFGQQNKWNNNNYQVISMQNNLPATVDLKNPALVEYIGEIFFKESFLDDPWKKEDTIPQEFEQIEGENFEGEENIEGEENVEGEEQGEEQDVSE